jgi:Flp pilus assembly protein TadD
MLGLAAWLQMQIWQDSEALWRWAVDVDPSCSVCQGNLGAAIATGPSGPARLDEAEGHLRRAIELRPDNAIPYFNLGNLFLARKQYDEAETAFLRYGELAPGHTNGLARLGLLALLRGHYADAIPLLERAQGIRARPAAAGDTSTVILLATAIGLVEDDPGVLILLGQALVEQGRPAEAIGPLRRAVTLAPWAVRAHVSLVLAYRDIGRADLVREELTVLRQLDPAAADHLPVR